MNIKIQRDELQRRSRVTGDIFDEEIFHARNIGNLRDEIMYQLAVNIANDIMGRIKPALDALFCETKTGD